MTRMLFSGSVCAIILLGAGVPVFAQDGGRERPVPETVEESEAVSKGETFVFKTEEEEEFEAFEAEMEDAFGFFGALFQAPELTPDQKALLPQAKHIAERIMPEGAMEEATKLSVEPMMQLVMAELTGTSRTRLAEVSGVAVDELEALDEAAAQEALDVFDPNYDERSAKLAEVTVDVLSRLLESLEPAYREALGRALVVRFDEREMTELLAFFDTPTGTRFARESFLVHYDPAMLGVMEQLGPAMVELLPEIGEEFEQIEADVENVRKFSELSEVERAEIARLLGKSVSELDALEPQIDVEALDQDVNDGVV